MSDDENPCAPCAYFRSRHEHDRPIRVPICVAPERTKVVDKDWTITNRDGIKCKHFDLLAQTTLDGGNL